VTDRGQANTSFENLSHMAPSIPGVAEATRIAPERKASPLPSPTSELNDPDSRTFSAPGIVTSDHPQSPATLIPATDGSSTRPTKGGIAYPFSLKVDGVAGVGSNASMLTLDSVGITTPPAVDVPQSEKELGAIDPVLEQAKQETTIDVPEVAERPAAERFFTAGTGAGLFTGTGAGLFSDGVQPDKAETETVERPPVERFETAHEDLSTLAAANGKP
jgi:hypothetical protein